jgi:hypothetical protein
MEARISTKAYTIAAPVIGDRNLKSRIPRRWTRIIKTAAPCRHLWRVQLQALARTNAYFSRDWLGAKWRSVS